MSDLTFGQALRVIRKRQRLTQAEVAKDAGIARQTLVGIERAKGYPTPRLYNRLVGALGFTSVGDLITDAVGGLRQCTSCKDWLPLDRFMANAQARDGLDSWCRACHVRATAAWRVKHLDHVRAYRAKRRPIENARARELWSRNRDAINAKRRAAYARRGVAK